MLNGTLSVMPTPTLGVMLILALLQQRLAVHQRHI